MLRESPSLMQYWWIASDWNWTSQWGHPALISQIFFPRATGQAPCTYLRGVTAVGGTLPRHLVARPRRWAVEAALFLVWRNASISSCLVLKRSRSSFSHGKITRLTDATHKWFFCPKTNIHVIEREISLMPSEWYRWIHKYNQTHDGYYTKLLQIYWTLNETVSISPSTMKPIVMKQTQRKCKHCQAHAQATLNFKTEYRTKINGKVLRENSTKATFTRYTDVIVSGNTGAGKDLSIPGLKNDWLECVCVQVCLLSLCTYIVFPWWPAALYW